jgi:DNA adenine methylase
MGWWEAMAIRKQSISKNHKIQDLHRTFLGKRKRFFSLSPSASILADRNAELINCYQAIKSDAALVRRYLLDHKRQHSETYYYEVRAATPLSVAKRAARFIYLNRSCWNGLYRVNQKGIFNVPRGTKNSIVFQDDDFGEVASRLKSAEIICADFEVTIAKAKKGDLVFADPPYTVLHNNNGFVKYNETIFSWGDQLRLRNALVSASERGAQVYLTNADHASVRELYKGSGDISVLHRHAKISGKNIGRKPTTELLVRILN